ncbi:transcriptional regulator ATRX [Salix suchowensis]|nr:transcriptional regulator ATRX [Salix suchowensis]
MNSSDHEKRDQRTSSSMEHSTAMTIEFLRARLLSERSVSRTARQRADELAERVAELEEQLRIVSLQRMKAEKATEDVLAILESNGISDDSEMSGSSSDQDTPCESEVGKKTSKQEENSVNLKVTKYKLEEHSGSDHDFSSSQGRNLSWKGRKHSPCSLEKCKDPSLRRRRSFLSTISSPKHHQGKSCRQTRNKESSPNEVDSPENGVATTPEVFPNCSESEFGGIENGEKKHAVSNELEDNVYGSDRDMEKALEDQARLIDRYEAMEKAQREWEDKFRENNGSTPEGCEIKARVQHHTGTVAAQSNRAKSEVKKASNIQPNGILPPSHVNIGELQEWKSSTTPTLNPELKILHSILGNNYHPSPHSSHHHPLSQSSHDSSGSQSATTFQSNTDSGFSKGQVSGRQNEQLYALVPHRASNELGGVLDALKLARQSLQQKISTLPLIEGGSIRNSVGPSLPPPKPGDKVDIPLGNAGLFRLPSDYLVEASPRTNLLSSNARLSLGNYFPDGGVPAAASNRFPDGGVPAAASNRFVSRSYSATGSRFPTEDQFLASQDVEGGSRISSQRPFSYPYLDTVSPPSARYSYPTNPSYPDQMPRLPSREPPSFLPGRTVGVPPADHFSFSDYHIRPNMYR